MNQYAQRVAMPPTQIAPNLWQSGAFHLPEICQRLAIDAIVNVATLPDPALPVPFQLWAPFEDGALPRARTLGVVSDTVVDLLGSGHRVLVHCFMGINRSTLVAALALHKMYALTGAEAFARIQALRPEVMTNPLFRAFLESLT